MFSIGPFELMIIMIVALVIVGPEKLPELARMIARAMRDLRKYATEVRSEFERDVLTEDVRRDLDAFTRDRPARYPYDALPDADEEEPYAYENGDVSQEYVAEADDVAEQDVTEQEEPESPDDAEEPSDKDYPPD